MELPRDTLVGPGLVSENRWWSDPEGSRAPTQPNAICSSCCSVVVGGGCRANGMGCLSPWFHHWFSKPLSTVIMADPRASRSRRCSGSSCRNGGSSSSGDSSPTIEGALFKGWLARNCGPSWELVDWGFEDEVECAHRSGSGSRNGSQPIGKAQVPSHGMSSSPRRNRDGTSGNSFHKSDTGRCRVPHTVEEPADIWADARGLATSQVFSLSGGGAEWPRSWRLGESDLAVDRDCLLPWVVGISQDWFSVAKLTCLGRFLWGGGVSGCKRFCWAAFCSGGIESLSRRLYEEGSWYVWWR